MGSPYENEVRAIFLLVKSLLSWWKDDDGESYYSVIRHISLLPLSYASYNWSSFWLLSTFMISTSRSTFLLMITRVIRMGWGWLWWRQWCWCWSCCLNEKMEMAMMVAFHVSPRDHHGHQDDEGCGGDNLELTKWSQSTDLIHAPKNYVISKIDINQALAGPLPPA